VEYVSLNVAGLLAGDFLRHPEGVRARWLQLVAYCAQQENGGRIEGAGSWPPRVWMNIGVGNRKALDSVLAAGLARWDRDALEVVGYPVDIQEKVVARRNQAKTSARIRWSVAANNAALHATGDAAASCEPNESHDAKRSVAKRSEEQHVATPAEPPPLPGESYKLADYLREKILAAKPSHKIGRGTWDSSTTRRTWARVADQMHRIDGREYKRSAQLARWAWSPANLGADASFIVESMKALRAKWDRLDMAERRGVTLKQPNVDDLFANYTVRG